MPTVVYLLQSWKAQRLFWACSFSVGQSICEAGIRSPCFTEKILVCREKTAQEPPLQIHLHCNKNLKQIFSEMKLLSLGPNFYIHVSRNDLYIPTICLLWNLIPSLNKKNWLLLFTFMIRNFPNWKYVCWPFMWTLGSTPPGAESSLSQYNKIEIPNKTFILDSHRPFMCRVIYCVYEQKRESAKLM